MKNSTRLQEFPTIPYLSSELHNPPVSTYEHTLGHYRGAKGRPKFLDDRPKRSKDGQKKPHSK
ncbi:hypothetical protein GCM10022378_19360 [Salinicoccus jeotgali]|uniref:Uncharacterized protein n=1 Tax=Salinicoccus jeotgali TaxID=381634 RepID=A0ABP7F494_9STAP